MYAWLNCFGKYAITMILTKQHHIHPTDVNMTQILDFPIQFGMNMTFLSDKPMSIMLV